jgi:putative exosortase-associated protein (TIGR04073 family)
MRRSIEQTYLWDGADMAFTTGVVRGFDRTVVRTALGAYEIATFPFPPYGPLLTSTNRVYPDYSVATLSYPFGGLVMPEHAGYPANFKPDVLSDSLFYTDTTLGFSDGDIAPMIPGCRFRVL